ncbi:hypothetical protein [Rubrimonas cliftonensis]|uniref:Asp/Glu/hydantoin racemase n=1 Tax=Rubrimonas cliftonensis TaxID=89524 RepID=A0A1H3Z9G6_9RHOB|nr:hypothetical protein [Rubrimonas cliftonensis]SEA19972.1 hypothetical protein SAMN05444370_103437 [Rubrimonas cliftonensis]
MAVAFIHTDASHAARFDAILAALAPNMRAAHAVAPHLLARARRDGADSVRDELSRLLAEHADAAALVCTCSTLGALAESLGRSAGVRGAVFRVDRPMMEAAARFGSGALLVASLDTAMAAAEALFAECAAAAGVEGAPETLQCGAAWPLFEAGDAEAFAQAVADAVRARVQRARAEGRAFGCVALAQASMAPAAALLADLGAPTLTSPELAVERALALSRAA